jgi:hypothetical protein
MVSHHHHLRLVIALHTYLDDLVELVEVLHPLSSSCHPQAPFSVPYRFHPRYQVSLSRTV